MQLDPEIVRRGPLNGNYLSSQIHNEDKLQSRVFRFFGSSFSLSLYKLYAPSPTLEHQYFIFTSFYFQQCSCPTIVSRNRDFLVLSD